MNNNEKYMSHPKFSVIIPLFNKEKYIKRAIQSVLKQTISDFEIVVVDDGSSDNSAEIVKSIEDSRIHYHYQSNAGVSAARNKGVEISSGKYMAFLDSDDEWLPEFLSAIDQLIEKYPNSGLYATNNIFRNPDGTEHYNKNDIFGNNQQGIIPDFFGLFAQNGAAPFSNTNFCVPKNIFIELGGYTLGVRTTEDSDFWSRIALKHTIAYDIRPLAIYHMYTTGSTHFLFEKGDFHVTKTLINALNNGSVKANSNSIKRLISLQKLNKLKRSLLAGAKGYSALYFLKNSKWLLRYNSWQSMQCFISLFIPTSLLLKLKGYK